MNTDEGRLALAAPDYARRGWSVLPLWPRERRPLHLGGYRTATNDVALVAPSWDAEPEANIGMAPGASGLLAISVDAEGSGSAAWLGLFDVPTMRIESSRGVTLLFKRPPFTVEARRGLAPGIAITCDSGFIVLPPSRLAGGDRYRWGDCRTIADLPPMAMDILGKARPSSAPAGAGASFGARGAR